MSAATKGARNRAQHRLRWVRDIATTCPGSSRYQRPTSPGSTCHADPTMLSDDEIEQAAEDARRYWRMGDGPIANMILLLENQGAVVARDLLGADTLDGLSQFLPRMAARTYSSGRTRAPRRGGVSTPRMSWAICSFTPTSHVGPWTAQRSIRRSRSKLIASRGPFYSPLHHSGMTCSE